ncbi:MAG: heavy-metal-associated domain-containing protein [Acidobacteriota bacterium]|nr:heavy-metal-associated domain-containing protein [Acidobacteriota bacterium]
MNQAEVGFTGDLATGKNAESGKNVTKSSCGCCGSGPASINRRSEEKVMTNEGKETKTTTIKAPEIVCGGCASSIKKALGKVRGVSEVEVDVATKKVTVKHGESVSRETITDALDRAGYSVAS